MVCAYQRVMGWPGFDGHHANAGMATRSYLYIDDVVEAYDIILHRGADGQTYNIGSQVERSVLSVAHNVLRVMRLPADKVRHVRDRAFNDRRYFVCDKKLAKLGGHLRVPSASTCFVLDKRSGPASHSWHALLHRKKRKHRSSGRVTSLRISVWVTPLP